MRMLFMAKQADKQEKVVGLCYASNILQAQANFTQGLPSSVLEKGIVVHETQAEENSPEAKLLIAIFGDDE